ncbi:MAG TPA: vitamin K epoxide reductase family protein [Acidimicrobiales bacterium]|nr:vitamin K epoxide reductase family protein [Acidimicrobiales bacterium]
MTDDSWADDGWETAPAVGRWRGWMALVLSIIGFGIGLYLTIDHFTGTLPVCSATGIINCAKVTTSPQSEVFGIPVALLGLLFFTAMIAINLPPLWRAGYRWVTWARLVMVVGGMGFVVYLLSAELFTIKAICLWCTGVHVLTFLLFVLVVASFPAMAGNAQWVDGAADEVEPVTGP